MSEPTIEKLQVEVESNAQKASNGLDALAATLEKLKNATKGGLGLNAVHKKLADINSALNSVNSENAEKLNRIAQSFEKFSAIGKIKISPTVATQISNLGNAVRTLDGVNFGSLESLTSAIAPLSTMNKANLNSFISQLQRLPQAIKAVDSSNITGLGAQVRELVTALRPLSEMGKNNLTSFITQLSKIPTLFQNLKSIDIGALSAKIRELAQAFSPLANEMQKIAAGFAAFPAKIQRFISSSGRLRSSNNMLGGSYFNLAAKIGIVAIALRRLANAVGSWIIKSNQYIENMNLFDASMGKYAESARKYAEHVGAVMGIDPGEWMRNQGIFMTLATGFGVVSDRAEIMSRNLTQLGYDLSSFFNISFDDSMLKLQSGIAGELEPLRRIGYDLSVARLQQEAYALGINKSVQAMTQAEKAELRYYAIMTQVTVAQGDMARTLEAPANQLRILKAQVEQAARALGNIFIPVLNKTLPYVIAFTRVIRTLADSLARLAGFSLPEIDYSGLDTIAGGGIGDALDDAIASAKKLKNHLFGIDELNILQKNDGDGGLGDPGLGGGLNFELPEYDFLGDAVTKKIDEIVKKMEDWIERTKEWLGLTEPIKSWADFMNTRLYDILAVVGAIGAGLLGWRIGRVLNNLGLLKGGLKEVLGFALAVGGAFLYTAEYSNAWVNGIDWENFIGLLSGAAAIIGGLWMAFGPLGGAIGSAAAGIGLFVIGIKDAIEHGLNLKNAVLIPLGSTLTGAGIGMLVGGPAGAGIGALIGLVVGLLTDLGLVIYQHWDEITFFMKVCVPAALEEAFKSIRKKFHNFSEATGYVLGLAYGKITLWLIDVSNALINETPKVAVYMAAMFAEAPSIVKKKASEIAESFINTIREICDNIVPIGKFIWEGFVLGLSSAWEEVKLAISKFVSGFIQGFKDKLGIKSPSTVFMEIGQFVVDGFLSGIETFKKIAGTVIEWAGNVVEWFSKGKDGKGIVENFRELGSNIISGFRDRVGETYGTVKDNVTIWATNIKDWFESNSFGGINANTFSTFANNTIVGFRNKIGNAYTNVKSNMTTWADKTKEWFTSSAFGSVNTNTFSTFANNTIEGFKIKIGSAYQNTKSNIMTWATNAKNWFTNSSFGGVNTNTFSTFANNTIEGFKNKIGSAYQNTRQNITTWATGVKDWFSGTATPSAFAGFATNVVEGFRGKVDALKSSVQSTMSSLATSAKNSFADIASSSTFYGIASDVISGFTNGISSLAQSAISAMSNLASNIIGAFKNMLDSNSPSMVFYRIGADTVLGYNNAIENLGSNTKGKISAWTDSFTNISPTIGMTVDTSALEYYKSDSFSKSISATVSSNSSFSVDGYEESMKEALREAIMEALDNTKIAENVRRQADKKEQTIVQVGNRSITDAVVTQQKANGYQFT